MRVAMQGTVDLLVVMVSLLFEGLTTLGQHVYHHTSGLLQQCFLFQENVCNSELEYELPSLMGYQS